MCEQYGSPYTTAKGDNPEDHFLFDNDTNKAFVKKFRDWYQKGYVTTQEIYGSYTSGLFTTLGESYTDADGNYVKVIKSYMSIGSSAGATHQRPAKDDSGNYPFEVGITSIPQLNAEAPKVISQGPSVCIFKKDNPQEVIASWLFVKFLTTSVDFQAEFSMASGYVPVIKSVTTNEVYADFISKANGGSNIAALSAKVCLDQEAAYYTSPAFNGSSTAREQVGALLQKCLLIGADMDVDAEIAKAFKDAVDECIYQS
jgi:multiple sugar transport system substrate-binding protein